MPGPWNSTIVKGLTPANAVARIAAMRTAGMRNFFMAQGPVGRYRVNGVFNLNLYIQSVRRWAPASSGRSAVLDAIADETLAWGYVKDEPRHPSRWGPGGIPLASMKTIVAVWREVFPDMRLTGRFVAGPSFGDAPGYGQPIPGLTAYWTTIKATRLPVATEVQRHLAEATALGAGLGCSINRRDFHDRGAANATNNPSGWITPTQMRLYGPQLAAFSQLLFMYGWWYADPEWYTTVADMPAAELYVRSKWIATHP